MDSSPENEKPEELPEEERGYGPEPVDTIESSRPKQVPLREKDFISNKNGIRTNPTPMLAWFLVIMALIALAWGGRSWFVSMIGEEIGASPFLQVTNREMSLFLWQNSEHMRINVKSKSGYLPAFQSSGDVGLDPELADKYIVAPPQVIFRYHTWNRLIKDEISSTPIPLNIFREFLAYAEEWQPRYWPDAPKGYIEFIKTLPKEGTKDLRTQPYTKLPQQVRLAFQGWQNYFKQGDEINQEQPTYAQMQKFLLTHPHFARNYWRNISTPNYLKRLASGDYSPNETIPEDEIASFLRVAYFNFQSQ